jgi:hypothetical protein
MNLKPSVISPDCEYQKDVPCWKVNDPNIVGVVSFDENERCFNFRK